MVVENLFFLSTDIHRIEPTIFEMVFILLPTVPATERHLPCVGSFVFVTFELKRKFAQSLVGGASSR